MKNKHIASWMLCSLFIMGCGSKVFDTVVSEKSLKEVVGDNMFRNIAFALDNCEEELCGAISSNSLIS